MEEISLDQRDLGSIDISNNYPVSRECENHKVGREEVEEVFLEDNVSVHVHSGTCICMCMWKPQVNLSCHFTGHCLFFFF